MLIDLHTHTYPCSDCSAMSADQLIERASELGLDAICVTDHHLAWGGRVARRLAAEKHAITVFAGVEARTTLGDVLVFGLDEDFPAGLDGAELLRHVDERGGVTVLAHPFRHGGGRSFWQWLDGRPLSRELAALPELAHLHAVETFNGQVNPAELAQAEELALILGLPATGGSDAHSAARVGSTLTEFARPVHDEVELAREIRAGRVRPWRLT